MGEGEAMDDLKVEKLLTQVRDELRQLNKSIRFSSLKEFGTVDVWYDNIKLILYLPDAISDRVQGSILMNRKLFEESNLQKVKHFIEPDSVVCDVGSNIGNHAIFFSKVCDAKLVYCFEPQGRLVEIIEKNFLINKVNKSRYIVKQAGCGDSDGSLQIVKSVPHNLGATQFRQSDNAGYSVVKIDSLNLKKLDFLKIDVERMGDSVLRGAMETIERCKPTIWMELYDEESEMARPILERLGYIQAVELSKADFIFVPLDR